MAIKLSDEVSKICNNTIKQSDLTKSTQNIKIEADKNTISLKTDTNITTSSVKSEVNKATSNIQTEVTKTANTEVNKITQDQLKKITSITEKTQIKTTGDSVTKQDITNFVKVNFTGEISTSVIKLIDKSADDIVKEQLGAIGKKLDDTAIGERYNKAKAIYNDIYKSDELLANMRAKYTKSMTSSIENIVNKQMNKFTSNKWIGKIMANSQLGSQITKSINSMVTSAINQLLSNQLIKGVTDSVKNTVTAMKKKATNYLKETFSSQYEYANKLKQAVKDKIKLYEEAKAKYIKQVTEYITKLRNEVNAYIKRVTQTIADSLQSSIKGLTSGIKF